MDFVQEFGLWSLLTCWVYNTASQYRASNAYGYCAFANLEKSGTLRNIQTRKKMFKYFFSANIARFTLNLTLRGRVYLHDKCCR
jgi:hypothetical protein